MQETKTHFLPQTTGNIEAYQAHPLIDSIIELGGWPVVENHAWNEESFNWIDTIIQFRKMGFNHNIFISVFVGPDFKNSTRHVAQVKKETKRGRQ